MEIKEITEITETASIETETYSRNLDDRPRRTTKITEIMEITEINCREKERNIQQKVRWQAKKNSGNNEHQGNNGNNGNKHQRDRNIQQKLRRQAKKNNWNNRNNYNIDTIDKNIDFRRVQNLKIYFENNAISLTTDVYDIENWQGGDIVIFQNHIGIVSNNRNKDGVTFIIHHANPLQKYYEEDILESRNDIIGHYRMS